MICVLLHPRLAVQNLLQCCQRLQLQLVGLKHGVHLQVPQLLADSLWVMKEWQVLIPRRFQTMRCFQINRESSGSTDTPTQHLELAKD